ncbi:uncharacterized protein PHACADRAFT_266538 [Phanerochaete carnosa HHB-10118-sp]|uniref:Uncharacterized protein n=1 Tax=Phanerochaete carnosa (strain HHB-10118-sp) TaxID=650164 RepID=K5VAM3_PHACS|nr:uncharacterized protein PHACADRAFT_266538 [Phanerochaete carnosa HHB-10118-sp]EKM48133.1 hypothetical protein PHACADRAFT_266538 [Phanerochaete carnosa HHB-10118-sp]
MRRLHQLARVPSSALEPQRHGATLRTRRPRRRREECRQAWPARRKHNEHNEHARGFRGAAQSAANADSCHSRRGSEKTSHGSATSFSLPAIVRRTTLATTKLNAIGEGETKRRSLSLESRKTNGVEFAWGIAS